MERPPADAVRLPRWSVAVRGLATVAALVTLTLGQVLDTNDLFPFGSLSQYATPRDLDGSVLSVYLEADTETGERVRVSLNQKDVGVGRAEIEGQLDRIIADPSLLAPLADAHAALHPDRPRLEVLHLMRSERRLEDGVEVGTPEVVELATWPVDEGSP